MMVSALPVKRMDAKLIDCLTKQDVRSLLDAPDKRMPAGLRDRAMLYLAYAAGLRASELLAVQMGDFPKGPFPNIRVLETARYERMRSLWNETQAALRAGAVPEPRWPLDDAG